MTRHLHVVRVPPCTREDRRRIRSYLRRLVDSLAWCTLDPERDTQVTLGHVAAITNLLLRAQRTALIAELRERADDLRKDGANDDELVAAAELTDLADDLQDRLDLACDTGSDAAAR